MAIPRPHHLRLRWQLLLAVGLPVLLVVALVLERVRAYHAAVDETVRQEHLLDLVQTALSLVYDLQVERGASASHTGSGGESFGDLASLRARVDGHLDDLTRLARQPEGAELFQDPLTPARFEILGQRLDELRGRVDVASGEFLPTFTLYSYEIDHLIDLALVWGSSNDDPWETREAFRLHLLQRMQESAGRVRGVLAGALGAGSLDPQTGLEIEAWIREEGLIADDPEMTEMTELPGGAGGRAPPFERYEALRGQLLHAAEKTRWREQLKQSLGYTGMIHRFKNYVLRGEATDRQGVLRGAESARQAIAGYRATGASPVEEQALATVEATIASYRRNLVVVDELRQRGAGVEAIDRAVLVDDGPARRALETLDSAFRIANPEAWFEIASRRVDAFAAASQELLAGLEAHRRSQAETKVRGLVVQLLLLAVVTLAVLFGALSIGRSLGRRLERLTAGVEGVERSGWPGDLDLDVGGSDEIGALAQAFRRAGGELAAQRRSLEEANRELETRVEDRTAEVTMALTHIERRERTLQSVLDGSHDLIQSVDAEGRLVLANRAWLEALEYTLDEVRGRPVFELIHPDSLAHCQEMFSRLMSQGTAQPVEASFVAKSGRVLQLAGRVEPVVDAEEGGDPRITRGYFRDLTTEAALRRDLERQEDLLRQFAAVSDQVFWIYDKVDGRFVFVNQAFETLSGRSPVELLENPEVFFELFAPEDLEMIQGLIARAQSGEPLEADHRIVDGAGSYKWVRLRTYPLGGREGEVTKIAGISEDVTAVRRSQAALRRKARIDPLTGVLNRAALEEDLERVWGRHSRAGESFAVFYLDLDGFKPVNDRYGHGAGDDVLVEAANRLRETSRPGDLVARLGGDEFVVVALGLSEPDAVDGLARRLARSVARPIRTRAGEVVVGASLGVAAAREASSPAELLETADLRMYRQKQAGDSRGA